MLWLISILICVGGAGISNYNKTSLNILIISSYNEYDPCGSEQIKGITSELEKEIQAESLGIQIEYMRARKINLTREAREEVADSFYTIFENLHPRIVFLVDDIAIEYMLPKLICDTCDYLVVFSGMNRDIRDYDNKHKFIDKWIGERAIPLKNVTGVIEKIYVKLSVRYTLKIFKNIDVNKDTVIFFMGKDSISRLVEAQIKRELQQFKDIPYDFIEAGTFDDFLNKLKIIENDKNIPFYYPLTLVIDSVGKRLGMNDLIPYYRRYMKKPGITLNKFFCQLGLFGGVGLNFYEMGRLAAKKAIAYITGTKVKQILIENADSVETIFNISRARQLNVKIPFGVILNAKLIQK